MGAGILIGIPTGPARFFVVDTRLNEGKTAAFKTYSGFLLAVLIYAALALLADGFLSRHKKVETVAYIVASLLLVLWGMFIILKSNKVQDSTLNFNFDSPFSKGFAAGISSPVTPFIYLAFLQILNSYTTGLSFFEKAVSIGIFEFCGFLTTWTVGSLLINKKGTVKKNWNVVKLVMGIFLICLGVYNFSREISFENGIQLEEQTVEKT